MDDVAVPEVDQVLGGSRAPAYWSIDTLRNDVLALDQTTTIGRGMSAGRSDRYHLAD